MVRAILAGTKVQTRRVVSLATSACCASWGDLDFSDSCRSGAPYRDGSATAQYLHVGERGDQGRVYRVFPRIEVGDVLWVREAFNVALTPTGATRHYAADQTDDDRASARWRPSIHMPRGAARILLRVKAIRVERLHEISADDCRAEGIAAPSLHDGADPSLYLRTKFRQLWDSLNAARAPWSSNPWVWVVEFERALQ